MKLSAQNSCHKIKLSISTCTKHLATSDALSKRGRRELWETRSWLLYHANAPAHIALGIREFLAKNNIAVLEQPPYSPDLAPCDLFLFPKLKEVIKGTRFQDSEAIKTAVTKELRAIPELSFQECVESWQRRLEKCIRAQGHYLEGDTL